MTGPTEPAGTEDPLIRRKRLRLRAWRRGTREMDLILGRYADAMLGQLGPQELDLFEALLAVEDPALMDWVTGRVPPPPEFAALAATLARGATIKSDSI